MVRHNGAVNHIFANSNCSRFADSAFLQTPSSSDICLAVSGPVLIGGTVVADYETVCDPSRFPDPAIAIGHADRTGAGGDERTAGTSTVWPPASGRFRPAVGHDHRRARPVSVVKRWLETYPGVRLVNATIWAHSR
jgi:hypothetical protein